MGMEVKYFPVKMKILSVPGEGLMWKRVVPPRFPVLGNNPIRITLIAARIFSSDQFTFS
jgi:hypothetical protein